MTQCLGKHLSHREEGNISKGSLSKKFRRWMAKANCESQREGRIYYRIKAPITEGVN